MKDKIESIQILRGLAALSVVLFHYRFYLVPDGSDLATPNMLFGWGAIGVDLFFVISGFIMIYVTHNKVGGFKSSVKFLTDRLTRILPAYYIILAFAFITGGAMSTFHYSDKTANLLSALTFRPYLTEPAPLYIDSNGMYNIRWTLSYELYFYLAFSICLLFKKRFIALSLWFLTPLVVVYFMMSEITFSTGGYNFHSPWARFLTNPIILEFGIGVLAGYAYIELDKRIKFKNCMLSFICLVLIAVGIINHKLGGYSLLSALSFFFLVLLFALQNNYILNFTPRFFIVLGNISFSWYLLHNPLGHFISDHIEKVRPGIMHNTIGFMVLFFASVAIAYLSHKYIEIKLTNKIRVFLSTKYTAVKA